MFPKVDRFKQKEFPKNEISLTDPRLFITLDNYAKRLRKPVYPSPARGALARMYGDPKSRHYAVGRLSTAVDFFPDGDINRALVLTLSYFKGVGVYFDTQYHGQEKIMLHGDLRHTPRYWYRENGLYTLVETPEAFKTFFKKLQEVQNGLL